MTYSVANDPSIRPVNLALIPMLTRLAFCSRYSIVIHMRERTRIPRGGGAPRERVHDSIWVKSAERTLNILEWLSTTETTMTFRKIEEALRIPRSSLHGLLRTLCERGWLERDADARAYNLGIRTWQVGHAYMRGRTLAQRAQAYMLRVQGALRETVQLAVLDGRHNVYIAKVDGPQRLVLASEVGRRLEAHATGLGKVLLAGLPTQEVDRRLSGVTLERLTPNTIVDHRALKRELGLVRRQGYALDNEEYTVGVRCVAVPVRDYTGEVTAAMSVSVPRVRFTRELRSEALRVLREASRDLSASLGFSDPGSSAATSGQALAGPDRG